jgi:hypothetical protein
MAEPIKFKIDADTSDAEKGAEKIASSFKKAEKEAGKINQNLKDGTKSGSKFGSILGGLKFGAGLAAGKGVLDKVMGSLVENEKVANLFNDALSVISGTAQGLVEILGPAFKFIGDAIKNPKEAWDDVVTAFESGAKFIKENLIDGVLALFTSSLNELTIGVLTLQEKWNSFTGDLDEATEIQTKINELQNENIEISKKQSERFENVKGAVKGAVDTLKDWGGTIANSIEKTFKGNQALRESTTAYILINAKIEENIKALESQQAQNEATANNERLTFEARKKAILGNIDLKKEQIKQEKQLLQNQINLLALENQSKGVSSERTAQIAALQVQIKGLDITLGETQRTVDDTTRAIEDQQKESVKAIVDATAEATRGIAEATAQTATLEHEKLKNTLDAIALQKEAYAQLYADRLSKETEGSVKYNEILAEQIAKEGEFNVARIQGEAEYTQSLKDYKKEQQDIELAALQTKATAINGALNGAKALFKENAEVQSAIAIAQAIMDTYVAANTALASAPPPFNFIAMAGVIATGIANVIEIQNQAKNLASEVGGSPPSANIPSVNAGPSISIAKSNVDSNMQLSQSLNRETQPPKAYVVSTEIRTADSLERKILQNATFG